MVSQVEPQTQEGATVVPEPQPQAEVPAEQPLTPASGEQIIEGVASPVQPPSKPRQYTEEEYRRLQAVADSQVAQRDAALQQLLLRQQIAQYQQQETQVEAADRAQVEQGLIPEQEVAQRKNLRLQTAQQQAQLAQLAQINQGLAFQGESLGYVVAASDISAEIAKEENLEPADLMELFKELVSGKKVGTVGEMRAKAERFMRMRAKEATKKAMAISETFDRGPSKGLDSEEQSLKTRYPTMFRK